MSYRDPLPEELKNPLWCRIWEVIKTWDINVPSEYGGYCGATGNHVCAIYDEVAAPPIQQIERRDELRGEVAVSVAAVEQSPLEWLCDKCDTVCPGPPQKGIRCVICPRCGGDTAPQVLILFRRLERQRDQLQTAFDKLSDEMYYISARLIREIRAWFSEFDMYRGAWLREIGGVIRHKAHEIDGFVLRTRDVYEGFQRFETVKLECEQLKAKVTKLERDATANPIEREAVERAWNEARMIAATARQENYIYILVAIERKMRERGIPIHTVPPHE